MLTNIYKLMYGTHAAKNCPITNRYMPRYLCVVTHDAIITNNTVVSQMAISHEKTIFTNNRFFFYSGATIHCYKFSDSSIVTYNYYGIFTLVFQILWNGGNNGTGKYPAVPSYSCTLHYCYIGTYPGTISYLHILV